jgi:integrase
MKETLLSDLIKEVKEEIRPLEHSQSTLYHYDHAWGGLCKYFTEHEQTMYSVQLARRYVLETRQQYDTGEILKWKFKLIRQTVDLLEQFSEHGRIVWKHAAPWGKTGLVEPYFISLSDKYIYDLERKGKGLRTIASYKNVSTQFLRCLEQAGFHDCSRLTLQDVSDFIPDIAKQYQVTSMRTVLSALRSFLAFATAAKLTSVDLTCVVPGSYGRKTAIVPTITSEEEQSLLAVIDRETAKGKRDYVIILLALRTGLRSSDISNLQLENLKWRTNTIEIIQQKTGRMLILPLLADVGNAIIDYLLHGRPSSKKPYVFIRSLAPYTGLSSSLNGLVSGYMDKAGIRQHDGDQRGLHCFRHSAAARLLAAETPLPIISTILGHADKNSTKTYLSTDLEHLRACALGLNGIEVAEGVLQ